MESIMNFKELTDKELVELVEVFVSPLRTEMEWFTIAEALEQLVERFKKKI